MDVQLWLEWNRTAECGSGTIKVYNILLHAFVSFVYLFYKLRVLCIEIIQQSFINDKMFILLWFKSLQRKIWNRTLFFLLSVMYIKHKTVLETMKCEW